MEVINEVLLSLGGVVKVIGIALLVMFVVFIPIISEIVVPLVISIAIFSIFDTHGYEGIEGGILAMSYLGWILLRCIYFYPWLESKELNNGSSSN